MTHNNTHNGRRYTRAEQITAYHEAGHAVMARYFGMPVYGASVVGTEDSAGRVMHGIGRAKEIEVDESDGKVEAVVCVAAAGYLASSRAVPRSQRDDRGTPDRAAAIDWLDRIAPDDEVLLFYRLLRMRTDRYLAMKWHQVEAVAQALLEHKTLNKRELLQVIKDANRVQLEQHGAGEF